MFPTAKMTSRQRPDFSSTDEKAKNVHKIWCERRFPKEGVEEKFDCIALEKCITKIAIVNTVLCRRNDSDLRYCTKTICIYIIYLPRGNFIDNIYNVGLVACRRCWMWAKITVRGKMWFWYLLNFFLYIKKMYIFMSWVELKRLPEFRT